MFRPVVVFVIRYTEDYFIQLCSGKFDAEISTSRPLFEYNTSVLSVWVNHVIIHKGINL